MSANPLSEVETRVQNKEIMATVLIYQRLFLIFPCPLPIHQKKRSFRIEEGHLLQRIFCLNRGHALRMQCTSCTRFLARADNDIAEKSAAKAVAVVLSRSIGTMAYDGGKYLWNNGIHGMSILQAQQEL